MVVKFIETFPKQRSENAMSNLKLQEAEFQQKFVSVNGTKLHYVMGGPGPGVAPLMLLIHGFPQTWWEWHKVMPALSQQYTVVAPDLRGVGLSECTYDGYTKRQLAADLHGIVESLDCGPAHLVGHDIGGMVAYAYATQFPARSLTILDNTIPGIGDWEDVIGGPRTWHFAFHQKRDLPEALITGKEHLYLSTFIKDRTYNLAAFSDQDFATYAAAYSQLGSLRAGLEWYRAMPQDALDNKVAGSLPHDLKVMGLGGETHWGDAMRERLRGVAPSVVGSSIASCGHFIPEEQPEVLVKALREFCQ